MLASVVASETAHAQIGSDRYASMVIDAQSGQVISAANPDEYRFPASLTKMMTIYMTFEAIRNHKLAFTDLVPISAWSASMPPTKLGLVPGTSITVEQAILGLVTKSANDAASALGELLGGGDEDRFAQMMTLRAHALGMMHTTYRNASGLPDWGQVTTARDLVVLARHLIQDFPEYYHYFSTPYFQFHGRMVMNHQTLLRTYAGADGLKTGYTEASGYNVVTSAQRSGTRIIGVVLGAANGGERDSHMAALLDQGFVRLGVPAPVEMARHTPYYRIPVFGSAHAATMPAIAEAPVEPKWVHGRHGAHRVVQRPALVRRTMATPIPTSRPARVMARKPALPMPPRGGASAWHRHYGSSRESRQVVPGRSPG